MAHILTVTASTTSRLAADAIMRFAGSLDDFDFGHPIVSLSEPASLPDLAHLEQLENEVVRLRRMALSITTD